jgi:hypothetical protein
VNGPHHYGDTYVAGEIAERGTIHGSSTIDIQVNPETLEVVAVWFRCRTLPFRVSEVTPAYPDNPDIQITAIDYLEGQ